MTATPPAVMPVFPLPNAVFFPGTELPLNVFEPRYVRMVEDLAAGDGWLAVALLRPGYEADYEGSPEMHEVAGAGRIVESRRRPDGTWAIRVEGLARVRMTEVDSDAPYRRVAVEELPEEAGDLTGREATRNLRHLLRLVRALRFEGLGPLDEIPATGAGRLALVNRVAAAIPAEPDEKQKLLELEGPARRLEHVLRLLRLAVHVARALRAFPRPERPEHN